MTASHDKTRGILLEAGTNEVEFLQFGVGNERYGVNVSKVTQILEKNAVSLTVLPQSDELFVGTISFRGEFISVFDLRVFLNVPQEVNPAKNPLIIAMEFNRRTIGFIADMVNNIERVTWDRFMPLESSEFMQNQSNVIGTVLVNGQVVMILDVEAMLARIDPSMNISTFADQVKNDGTLDRSAVRIVYCEDSQTIKKLTLQVLNSAGFTNIHAFEHGAEGLDYVRTHLNEVDLILSDIEMPNMDGLAFCKEVKGNAQTKNIPFVFFSSLINDQMKVKCDSVNSDACFSKPEIHLIVDSIDSLYRKSFRRSKHTALSNERTD